MNITFVSCFYILKSKFDANVYIEWMNNFLSIVNNFYLVIFTNNESLQYINTNNNPNIKIIIKPLEEFYNYKYKDYWIKNHERNSTLNYRTDWTVNMLWSEKIHFVYEVYNNKYFETEYYGWCDIGYFRNKNVINDLKMWPNNNFFTNYNKSKISYAIVNNDDNYMKYLYSIITNKNEKGLPKIIIPETQISVAGGFFLIHKDKIEWWFNTYDNKLKLYFENNYLVKDDQIILIDCIISQLNHFLLYREIHPELDNWFMFQRILC